MIILEVNNDRKLYVVQGHPDGQIRVRALSAPRDTLGTRNLESEYEIDPGDFVTMLNWYRHLKEQGLPISF